MKAIKIIVISFLCLGFVKLHAQDTFQNKRLSKLWVSKEGNKTPESVLFDPKGNVLYVSNIDDNPWEKDNKGYISKMDLNGNFIEKNWVNGISAPKGMGISNGKLYVTNIDEVIEIDLQKATIDKKYTNPNAQNLNDITVGSDGTVYISDSKGDCIFQIKNKNLEILIQSPEIQGTNGIFFEKGKILIGQGGRIGALDPNTKTIFNYIENTGYIDGLEAVGDGSYVISDWSGKVQLVQKGKPNVVLLNTTPVKVNAADIGFDPKTKTLFVPTFFDNNVVAYKLE